MQSPPLDLILRIQDLEQGFFAINEFLATSIMADVFDDVELAGSILGNADIFEFQRANSLILASTVESSPRRRVGAPLKEEN